MRHFIFIITLLCLGFSQAFSQAIQTSIGGSCGNDCKWSYDGYTLTISNTNKKGKSVEMNDYNTTNMKAPWIKKKLDVKKVHINKGVKNIGSCAFANMPNLQEVIFDDPNLNSIGWGAFLNCGQLRTISLPINLKNIETIAFANCDALSSVKIPDQCRVGDQAYASCDNLKSIELSPTAILGHYVFAGEKVVDGKMRHTLYAGEVRNVPTYINKDNCNEYGFAPTSINTYETNGPGQIDYDYETSDLDSSAPMSRFTRNNTYALIIGNQNYRFVSDVPYAIHDARVFADYCKKTLGIPAENIHVSENATKQMILEEEIQDWVSAIPEPENKKLIVYYAGHGVPDVKNKNKAYILPTDVRGTSPQRGIALDDFYQKLGDLDFLQTTVFLDACFSGVNRENEGVTDGLRAVEIAAEDTALESGNIVVFSAAQGNETAQGYPEQGHGLFTYYLLNELNSTNGEVTFGELSDRINTNVLQKSKELKMRKDQTPTTTASENLTDRWRRLRF